MSRRHRDDRARAAEGVVERLHERIAALEADLDLFRRQNERLVRDGGRDHQENAVLRYQLAKCQNDRQVLEWHLGGLRAELRLALGPLSSFAALAEDGGATGVEAALLLAAEARAVGEGRPEIDAIAARAARAWRERFGATWQFEPCRLVLLRAGAVLHSLERVRDAALNAHAHPADGLAGRDASELEELREEVMHLVEWLVNPARDR